MNGAEIKSVAELYVKLSLSDSDALIVINEALAEISDLGLVCGTAEIIADESIWYELPVDATSIREITDEDGNYVYDYKIIGDKIKFSTAGQYTITARKQPAVMESLAVEPDVHPLFQRAIVTYYRAFLKLRVDDTSKDGEKLKQQFYSQIQRAFETLRPKKQGLQWRVIRHA